MKKNVFLDTWLLSRIVWDSKNNPEQAIRRRWDLFLDETNQYFPGLLEQDFSWVKTDALCLEVIGLGKIKCSSNNSKLGRKKNENLAFTYEALSTLVYREEWKNFSSPELFIQHINERIDHFIETVLSPRNLRKQAFLFQTNYRPHNHAHFMFAAIKKWRKEIDEASRYNIFKNNIKWDAILRYPFIEGMHLNVKNKADLQYAQWFWGQILGLLFREYFEIYSQDVSFETSSLGLFSEINRVWPNGNVRILKPWTDMVDAESIHFALIGKRKTLYSNEPMIVITGDKKEDVKIRLESLYKSLDYLVQRGKTIQMNPGIIICCSQNLEGFIKIDAVIKVQDFINTLSM